VAPAPVVAAAEAAQVADWKHTPRR